MSISSLATDYIGKSLSGLIANNMDTIEQVSKSLVTNVSTTSKITMNMYEKNNQYHYEFEVPGIEKDNINLSQKDGFIVIKGERKYKNETKKEDYQVVESVFGKFERRFRLPDQANNKSLKASFKNGMLLLTVDKIDEEENMQKIEIN